MTETYHLRAYYHNTAIVGLLFITILSGALVWIALTESGVQRARLLLMAGAGFTVIGGASGWLLLAYWRCELVIQEERIASTNVLRSRRMTLPEVREARWRIRPLAGSLVLVSGAERVTVEFGNFTDEQRDRLVRFFRESIALEAQTGWDLFAYKITTGQPPVVRDEPSEGEVLLTRRHWDCYLLPFILASILIGGASWWVWRELRYLSAPVMPMLLWISLRASTPARGFVVRKLSAASDPGTTRWLLFLLAWLLIAVGGLVLHEALEPRLPHPDLVLVVGGITWFVVLLTVAVFEDRRQNRRDHEAAKAAAREREAMASRSVGS